jgi:hypothetical protein
MVAQSTLGWRRRFFSKRDLRVWRRVSGWLMAVKEGLIGRVSNFVEVFQPGGGHKAVWNRMSASFVG